MSQRRELARAVLEDPSLASCLLALTSQGTLRALSQTCRRWSSDAFTLAPGPSRTLSCLSSWPQAVDEAIAGAPSEQELRRQRLKALRDRLVEDLRRESCQVAEELERSSGAASRGSSDEQAGIAPGSGTTAADLTADTCAWFCQPAFRDRHTSDADLVAALQRGTNGDVRRLIICSSQLSNNGLARALETHWAGLTRLCLRNCEQSGAGEGKVTGAALASLAFCQRPLLTFLTLIGIPDVPVAKIAGACPGLRVFAMQGRLGESCGLEALAGCPKLEVLRLSLEPRAPSEHFFHIFSCCRQLRILDVYDATCVSDQLLGSLMLHAPGIDDFSGRHHGGSVSSSGALTAQMVAAFRSHYRGAQRIRIDNLVADSLL
ncbi:unnamed protein product [Polarella glacialis]|uniref:Uncharacterized protein n=1 Tax=Polarella glacialis TaxID=89957 RepID=A0A813FGN1_POLGL|nr:unnamed protein product [Polarella glacialis]